MTKEKLQQLKSALELIRKLITLDIYYSIYDENCVVQYIYPEDGHKDGIYVGSVFHDPTGKLDEALQTGKCIHNFLPMEKLGFSMEGNIVPIYEAGKLCGAITSAYVPVNQQQLTARELAVQSIYYLILSIEGRNNHCNKLYFNNDTLQLSMDAQHFDDFCDKLLVNVYPEEQQEFREFTAMPYVHERLQTEKNIMMECRLRDKDQEYRWMELVFKRVEEFESSDVYENFLFMIRDIHERKAKEVSVLKENQELIAKLQRNNQVLFEQSITDELTKLYNRKGLVFSSMEIFQNARNNNLYIYTFVADLNGLKYINDNFGHEQGDKAIKKIAGMLKQAVPPNVIVTRSGGDEFIILAALEADSTVPGEIEKSFIENMKEFNSSSGLPYMIEASYGWDFCPVEKAINLDVCVSCADKKMYQMKEQRKVPGNFSQMAQDEISRRFSCVRQQVVILSSDTSVQKDIAALFDDNYLISVSEAVEDVTKRLEETNEVFLLFVDNDLPKTTGFEFIRELPDSLKQHAVIILLLQSEQPGLVSKAFALGVDDVLTKPYNTELNQCHMTHLFRMNIANRKLSQLLDNHEVV